MIAHAPRAATSRPRRVPLIPSELESYVDPNAAVDPDCCEVIAYEWPRLCRMLDDLAELYDDVPITDFVAVLHSVFRMSAYGVVFDAGFLARLEELQASIILSDEGDADGDWLDEGYDDDYAAPSGSIFELIEDKLFDEPLPLSATCQRVLQTHAGGLPTTPRWWRKRWA